VAARLGHVLRVAQREPHVPRRQAGVEGLLRGPAATCGPSASVAEVAALMQRSGAAVVVVDADGAPLGIVTDRDLRAKVVAMQRDAGATRAADVMSSPLVTVKREAIAFEALLEMTRREIHHLVVVDAGGLAGVLPSDDLLLSQAVHPVALARDIARAPSREVLARHAAGVTGLVQRLVDDGGRAGDIARIVAELNDRLVARVLAQAEAALTEAYGPLGAPQSARRVVIQQWIAPGRDLVGTDGIVMEIPGLLVQITSPPTHHQVPAPGTAVRIHANVAMMCGCPIEGAGTVWPQQKFDVSALIAVAAGNVWRPVQVRRLEWTGEPSQFRTEWTLPGYGFYQVTVFAREQGSANTGVDRVTVFCPRPSPPG